MARGYKTGGRKKGTPNKATTEVKNALISAFDEMGGVPALVEWGRENPTEFYKLWVKVMPVQQTEGLGDGQPVEVILKRAEPKDANG